MCVCVVILLLARPERAAASGWRCPPLSAAKLLHVGVGYVSGPEPGLLTDVRVGLLCVLNRTGNADAAGLHLVPELSYVAMFATPSPAPAEGADAGAAAESTPEPAPRTVHLGAVGVSAGYGGRWASVAMTPRLLVGGDQERGMALGLRHSLHLRFVDQLMSLEVGHQVLRDGAGWHQGLVAGGSINVAILATVLAHLR